jgi:hypothetical protein
MARDESESTCNISEEKEKIVQGWTRFSKVYRPSELDEQVKIQFDKLRFAEEQAKKTNFVLGGPIKF